jgi:exosortase/archaeosortase family protein
VVVLVACVVAAMSGFFLLVDPIRRLEIAAAVLLARPFGGRVSAVGGDLIQGLPAAALPFRATVTPFCSSLIPILALGSISMFILAGSIARRAAAFAIAAATILCCNVIRIAASVLVGLRAGPAGLALFHDWVGTGFALAYTLGGFMLMLYVLLPKVGRMPGAWPGVPAADAAPGSPRGGGR